MQHFAGLHSSLDFRTALPRPFLGFYPAVISQGELDESINIISPSDATVKQSIVGPPKVTEPLQDHDNYDTSDPVSLHSFGETVHAPLGDLVLGRSGDKGANVNCGFYAHTDDEWDWLRSFLTRERMRQMMGADWKDW